jgi:hypothetical protein
MSGSRLLSGASLPLSAPSHSKKRQDRMGLLDKLKKDTTRKEDFHSEKELEKVKQRLTKVENRTTFLETQLKVVGRK